MVLLAKDISEIDPGSENWSRLVQLLKDFGPGGPERWKGTLLVVYRGLKPLHAVDLGSGLKVKVDFRGASRLDALSAESGFPRVIALEEDALERVVGHARRDVNCYDDYFRQWGALLEGLSREWRKTIFVHPPGRRRIPFVSHKAVERSVNLLVPDGTLLLFAVTENWRTWASIILGYRDGAFWLVSSLDTLGVEELALSDGALEEAAESLRSRYSGTVRAITVERESLSRISKSRFPPGAALWEINCGGIQGLNIPLRWKLIALVVALVSSLRHGPQGGRKSGMKG